MKKLLKALAERRKNCRKPEFSKFWVGFLMFNSTVWIYMSYALAYLGREEIAETLSKTIVTEVLGVFAAYSIKALFENLSKNNKWPDKDDKTKDKPVNKDRDF